MASKTDIGNRAVSKLGGERFSNIDTDNTKPAKVIRAMWDIIRDALLCEYPWSFALTRTQLAKDTASPSWGYNNQFTLPSDFLALVEIKGNPDYRMESASTGGNRIVTNEGSPLFILYIRRVVNTAEFDPLFLESFATRLAYEGCEELTQSNTKKQILGNEFKESIRRAYVNNSIQNPPQELRQDEWLLSRESSIYYEEIDYNGSS